MGASVHELKHAAKLQEWSAKVAECRGSGSESLVHRARHSTENVLQLGEANRKGSHSEICPASTRANVDWYGKRLVGSGILYA